MIETSLLDDGPDAPVFHAPWESQAFALVLELHRLGLISWEEWAEKLSGAIAEANPGANVDRGQHYYRYWLNALEDLTIVKGLVSPAELQRRKQEWHSAYLRTPHGQPVELQAGECAGESGAE